MSLPGNRRQADRRKGDRRRPPLSTGEPSTLGPWDDPALASPRRRGEAEAAAEVDADMVSDSRFLAREAVRLVSTEGAALPRILRTYVAARAVLSLVLVLMPWVSAQTGGRAQVLLVLICLAYAGQAVSLWLLHDPGEPGVRPDHLQPRQWLWTIGIDLLAFLLLRFLDPAGSLNYTALLVLPVLMSGVLTRRVVAMGTAAGLSLLLLLGAWPATRGEPEQLLLQLSQAGLAGAGLFLIALLASELSQRLAREERSARSSLELARQQTLLNRLVIEEMTEGVMVVDRQGNLRAINPAGRQLLGAEGALMTVPSPLAEQPALRPLHDALQQAYGQGSWPAAAREVALDLAGGEHRQVQVRARFTRRSGIGADGTPPEDVCVLFLEDLRVVMARARQDKLAAMGRVSAGIAHEIRNPLAAIAQANDLLQEDELPPPQRRLARIVGDNAQRLKRIVDDVLAVAPGASSPAAVMDATAEVAQTVDDWRRAAAAQSAGGSRLVCSLPEVPLPVRFDADHLRRVLVNLLDNADRHADAQDGAVRLSLAPGPAPGKATLTVASDGEPIAPSIERHLFEPFFSTRSRGSGLGLYICRELCERHGASIDFRLAPAGARHRNVFQVVMRLVEPA